MNLWKPCISFTTHPPTPQAKPYDVKRRLVTPWNNVYIFWILLEKNLSASSLTKDLKITHRDLEENTMLDKHAQLNTISHTFAPTNEFNEIWSVDKFSVV